MSKAKEEEVLLQHEYDGIREFDNPTPGWWNGLLILTVIFSVGYLGYYHLGSGPSVVDEYAAEVKAHQVAHPAPPPADPSTVSEAALAQLGADPEAMSVGKAKYDTLCVACHGPVGQGIIGPNLTDEYWIHGKGTLTDILHTVDVGVPEKGMPAWGKMMKPEELRAVVAYAGKLRGTHAPGGKAPQGEKVGGAAPPAEGAAPPPEGAAPPPEGAAPPATGG